LRPQLLFEIRCDAKDAASRRFQFGRRNMISDPWLVLVERHDREAAVAAVGSSDLVDVVAILRVCLELHPAALDAGALPVGIALAQRQRLRDEQDDLVVQRLELGVRAGRRLLLIWVRRRVVFVFFTLFLAHVPLAVPGVAVRPLPSAACRTVVGRHPWHG
jgi:hypothetical protein